MDLLLHILLESNSLQIPVRDHGCALDAWNRLLGLIEDLDPDVLVPAKCADVVAVSLAAALRDSRESGACLAAGYACLLMLVAFRGCLEFVGSLAFEWIGW